MVRLGIGKHKEFEDDLKRFFSALLPHNNSDVSYFGLIFDHITKLVHVDELEGEYYLFLYIAEQLNKISYHTGRKPVFSRDVMIRILESNLYDIVSKDEQGFGAILNSLGKKGDNLKDIDAYQEASSVMLNRCIDLYDFCYDLEVSPDIALSYLISFRSNYKSAVMNETLSVQGELAFNSFRLSDRKWDGWKKFLAKKNFQGSDGWVDFIGYIHNNLVRRIREAEEEFRPLTSIEDAMRLKEDVLDRTSVIAEYGIPPIDNKRPIMKTGFTVLIGKPNLGKTTIAVNWLVNVLLKRLKVAIFSKETPESSMLYEYILPVYIKKKYNFFVTYEQIVGIEEVGGVTQQEISERQKQIKMAITDVVESGCYLYIPSLNAWNLYSDLSRIYSDFPFDYLIIDHSLSLHGGGETTPRLNALSSAIKDFKNDFKTSICLLSHPSPAAKKIISRAGAEGLTKYSTQIEGDADSVYYMFDTPELEARNLIGMVHTKGRGASKILEVIYLTKMFQFKYVIFDPKEQNTGSAGDEIINKIPNLNPSYDDDDEDYDEDDF